MNKDKLIEFAKEQCEIFPEDSEMREYLRETLKMLQAEPCEDCVSRQAVKEGSVMGMYHFLGIDELPSVTPKKDGWIPCSEKMPKQNEYIGNVCKCYLVQDKYDDMYVARYAERGWNPIDTLFFLDDVVAWMPLPEPYKE